MLRKLTLLLLAFATAVACNQNGNYENHLSGYAQGSTYRITFLSSQELNLGTAVDSILNVVDQSVSTYERGSLISQVNRGDTVKPDAILLEMLRQSRSVFTASQGAFDPSIGKLVQFWGFGPKEQRPTDSLKVDSLLAYSGFQEFNWSTQRFYLPKGFQLDFNAIAQGYTVDLIGEFFEQKGVGNYLVEVGGEVRCRGKNLKDKTWTIGIDKPIEEIDQQNRFQVIVALENAALATSGNYRKFWVDEKTGQRYAHTLNPKSGFPARNNLLSASVIAPTAALADAYATVFMVMGLEKSVQYLNNSPIKLEAYLISAKADSTWAVYQTAGFEKMVLNAVK
jgi:thiamine biosynthesis lipoprotein